jgi:hypothetical protein
LSIALPSVAAPTAASDQLADLLGRLELRMTLIPASRALRSSRAADIPARRQHHRVHRLAHRVKLDEHILNVPPGRT